jgi:hypothetical protein
VLWLVVLAACASACGSQQDDGVTVAVAEAGAVDERPGVADAVQAFAMLLGVGSPNACGWMTADLQASFEAGGTSCAAAVDQLARSGLDLHLPELAAAEPGAVTIAGDRASLVVEPPGDGALDEPATWSLRRGSEGRWLLEQVPFALP